MHESNGVSVRAVNVLTGLSATGLHGSGNGSLSSRLTSWEFSDTPVPTYGPHL